MLFWIKSIYVECSIRGSFVFFVLMLLYCSIELNVVVAYESARVLQKFVSETSKQELSWYVQIGMGV